MYYSQGATTNYDHEGTPPKPPPPVLPHKPTKSAKQQKMEGLQMKLDLVQQDSAGSDSTSSNVSWESITFLNEKAKISLTCQIWAKNNKLSEKSNRITMIEI